MRFQARAPTKYRPPKPPPQCCVVPRAPGKQHCPAPGPPQIRPARQLLGWSHSEPTFALSLPGLFSPSRLSFSSSPSFLLFHHRPPTHATAIHQRKTSTTLPSIFLRGTRFFFSSLFYSSPPSDCSFSLCVPRLSPRSRHHLITTISKFGSAFLPASTSKNHCR